MTPWGAGGQPRLSFLLRSHEQIAFVMPRGAAQAPVPTSSPTAGCLGGSTLIGTSGPRLTTRFGLSQGTEQLQCCWGGAGLVQPWL